VLEAQLILLELRVDMLSSFTVGQKLAVRRTKQDVAHIMEFAVTQVTPFFRHNFAIQSSGK